MAEFPNLYSERLLIRAFQKTDLTETYVSWLNDPDVVRYSEQRHQHHSIESCLHYFASFKNSPNYFCAIIDRLQQQHIGNLTITIDESNKRADIAILIGNKQYWSKGIGTEVFKVTIDWLLKQRGMRKVTAGTMAANRSMVNVMKRSNMEIEAVRKRHFLLNGNEVDLICAAKFSESECDAS